MASKPQVDLEEGGSSLDSHPQTSLLVTGLLVLLAALLLWKTRPRRGGEGDSRPLERPPISSQCPSPTCMRCHGEEAVKDYLRQRYREYISGSKIEDTLSDANSEDYPRVVCLIDSLNQKKEILIRLYQKSGYKIELSDTEPHVWYMPGLERRPLWDPDSHFSLADSTSLPSVQEPENFKAIQAEFDCISVEEAGWKVNSTPTGKWSIFPLYNQGLRIEGNTARCPQTTRLLEKLPQFMKGSVFGNAMFSSLEPGSTIEPHTGPCNLRLRCHLPLQAPPMGCNMQVGLESVCWEVSRLLVFDDSYVHTVKYSSQSVSNAEQRVLLIFDIWHPQVTSEEQEILNFIFRTCN